MEKLSKIFCLLACAAVFTLSSINADTNVTVNPSATWVGFMNVFALGAPGYGAAGAGGFVFGSGWGTPDLKASFAGAVLTLSANTIGDPAAFWYTPSGGPGATGNKIMDASMYVEPAGSLPGQTVTFSGLVLGNTLGLGPVDGTGHGWTTKAFIKDFAPDFSSFVVTSVDLTPGMFSISLSTIADGARHVQYGFETIGPDVWAGDPLSLPSATVTAALVPEPSSIALALAGLLGFVTVLRKRRA